MNRLVGLILAGVLVLLACTVGSDYTKPVVTTPDAWYEAHIGGGWDVEAPDVAMPTELRTEADEERLFSIPPSEG
jgi:hypothetical protein